MILSFHPLYTADVNLNCAGRNPGTAEQDAVRRASAVLLPQGCHEPLYRLARENCPHVFPNYDARFAFPGKCGQIRLFRQRNIPHPTTRLFASLAQFKHSDVSVPVPAVLKFDWGGEGRTVHRISTRSEFEQCAALIKTYESSGQYGFMMQAFVPNDGRSLRVVVVNEAFRAYWRVLPEKDGFYTQVSRGAVIDAQSDPALQKAAVRLAEHICRITGINLAGFDFVFSTRDLLAGRIKPLLLEINYFFGRRGLGGSRAYYHLLLPQMSRWLKTVHD